MHRKKGVAPENRQDPETLVYTRSALDDLGRKNASLLSQMRAGANFLYVCIQVCGTMLCMKPLCTELRRDWYSNVGLL